MGFSASWIAVQGVTRDDLLTSLSWEPSGRRADHPEFRLCIADLPHDWRLIWFDDDIERAFREVAGLPPAAAAVACAIEEHVMVSEARGYANGAEIWRVTHDPDEGLYHLATAGAPPAQLAGMLEAAKAEQAVAGGEDAEVDLIFDVPADLAKSICGFKHDEEPPESVTFEELRRAKGRGDAAKPSFLARLFGAR